jgi:hypothetical protein
MTPVDSQPLQLLQSQDPEAFLQNVVLPQLQQHEGKVLDVYPTTQVQKYYLLDPATHRPRTLAPFYIDFSPDADVARLRQACLDLIQHYDIFRTVFVADGNEFYQAVCDRLQMPIEVMDAEGDLAKTTQSLWATDKANPPQLSEPLLRIAFIRGPSALRVMLRMSHALYDGLSLEHILRTLHALYNGTRPPAPPKFVRYIQHMVNSRQGSYDFWRSHLQGSSMTVLKGSTPSTKESLEDHTWSLSRVIQLSRQARTDGITQATIFTTACAIMLAKETKSQDVVFGRVVSGRQCLPPVHQDLVGPCTNIVPMRVTTRDTPDLGKLLRDVQDQYLNSFPFETLGFDDIKEHCTEWPESVAAFSCCTTFHNFDMQSENHAQDQRIRLESLSFEADDGSRNAAMLHDLELSGVVEADGQHLKVTITSKLQVCGKEMVGRMLVELCKSVEALTSTS